MHKMIYLFKYWKYFGEIAKMVYASDWNSEDSGSIPDFPTKYGFVVELVYTHALGACAVRHESSNLSKAT